MLSSPGTVTTLQSLARVVLDENWINILVDKSIVAEDAGTVDSTYAHAQREFNHKIYCTSMKNMMQAGLRN